MLLRGRSCSLTVRSVVEGLRLKRAVRRLFRNSKLGMIDTLTSLLTYQSRLLTRSKDSATQDDCHMLHSDLGITTLINLDGPYVPTSLACFKQVELKLTMTQTFPLHSAAERLGGICQSLQG